jgi:hypothetical protein
MTPANKKKFNSVKYVTSYIKKECAKRNCTVKLFQKQNAFLKNHSDGEFCESEMEIYCYKNLSDKTNYWLAVLAHEYCHLIQSLKNKTLWSNFQESASLINEEVDFIFSSKKIGAKNRKKVANSIIRLELDCEKKTIKLLRKLKAPIDYDYYIFYSNIVLYKYLYWARFNKWISTKHSKKEFDNLFLKFKNNNLNKFKSLKEYKSVRSIPFEILKLFKQG